MAADYFAGRDCEVALLGTTVLSTRMTSHMQLQLAASDRAQRSADSCRTSHKLKSTVDAIFTMRVSHRRARLGDDSLCSLLIHNGIPSRGGSCCRSSLSGALRITFKLRKLDMVLQHCKWIACGTDGLGGKGCTRMRPKLHLPVLGTPALPESLVSWHIDRNFEGCAVPHRSIRE